MPHDPSSARLGGLNKNPTHIRLGVLDVGSNTVHLLIVDAHRGGRPTPMSSNKSVLRLAEQMDSRHSLTEKGQRQLVDAVSRSADLAKEAGCAELMAFVTSAIREAKNADQVLKRVWEETGVQLTVLSGADEGRLTFLAMRRWHGWGAGRILGLDIGGGSLELALGGDEEPEVVQSLPLGAGRVTRHWAAGDPPTASQVSRLREWLEAQLAPAARMFAQYDPADLAVASSKTFRSLARLTGAAPSSAGPLVRRSLSLQALRQLTAFISRMSSSDLATLDGVSADRAHQLIAGALIAEAAMRTFGVQSLEICPWALREGVILRRLDAEVHPVFLPAPDAAPLVSK
ncbi:Ppx/GppA phosphatase [Segniliparus rotundus DSM 44985]|uniref:Ppx/GppA phosphatase n=1 Tax=Segniliparus rotundus (strain ATCC BAA-972 / CDC 1076 / CIP 108378 / DSM 44985 / JCM 13578) TaxID=640132 RepID=D6Z816_SEGRD|nr:Ppx/GppA phosphatase [Segniliparus rotundus DSM 44985]